MALLVAGVAFSLMTSVARDIFLLTSAKLWLVMMFWLHKLLTPAIIASICFEVAQSDDDESVDEDELDDDELDDDELDELDEDDDGDSRRGFFWVGFNEIFL